MPVGVDAGELDMDADGEPEMDANDAVAHDAVDETEGHADVDIVGSTVAESDANEAVMAADAHEETDGVADEERQSEAVADTDGMGDGELLTDVVTVCVVAQYAVLVFAIWSHELSLLLQYGISGESFGVKHQ